MDGKGARPRERAVRALLAGVIVAGGFALWTLLPYAWLQLTGGMSPGARFVLVIVGLPITMALALVLLVGVDTYRQGLRAGWPDGAPGAIDEDPAEEGRSTLLELTLTVSAIIALVGLVLWWAFLADSPDPSGPLQPI
jgi:RsiW-degrading membrane proteinase PrsW (M82 family)